jgi:hypothetical protein
MDNNKDIEDAIEFSDKKFEAISFMNKEINGKDTFAITKFTNNGKYLRGNLLCYSLNGVEIYTDKENIIFVDLVNKKMFIRKYEEKINQIDNITNTPKDKEYIVLYTDIDDDGESDLPLQWEAYIGREDCYIGILSNVHNIDIDRSIVLVDTVPVKDALSVRDFVNYIKNADYIEDDGIDINDYSGSGYI